jgi:proteasome lid subunit RPN8/RPN11
MIQTGEQLVVTKVIRDEIIAHARDHKPRECCGIVSARQGALIEAIRLTNTEQNNTRYLFDDEEFFRVYWEVENRGEEVAAIYHSHPATVAWPSKTDVEFAFWPEAVYLICSLEHDDAPVIRGFRIIESTITEVDLT